MSPTPLVDRLLPGPLWNPPPQADHIALISPHSLLYACVRARVVATLGGTLARPRLNCRPLHQSHGYPVADFEE
ncbi:hypothetical protein C1886_03495 [Pseudomonas sp. FW300-N1A1]|nr:hypothetical protein C1886_03495 [Pseudomonas sp. FW300-N1A1]